MLLVLAGVGAVPIFAYLGRRGAGGGATRGMPMPKVVFYRFEQNPRDRENRPYPGQYAPTTNTDDIRSNP